MVDPTPAPVDTSAQAVERLILRLCWNEDCPSDVEIAALLRALLSQRDTLLEALMKLDRLYRNVWDRTDGCLVLFPDRIEEYEAASAEAQAAIDAAIAKGGKA